MGYQIEVNIEDDYDQYFELFCRMWHNGIPYFVTMTAKRGYHGFDCTHLVEEINRFYPRYLDILLHCNSNKIYVEERKMLIYNKLFRLLHNEYNQNRDNHV